MTDALVAELKRAFPMLYRFVDPEGDGRFAVGAGWEFVVRRVCARLEPLIVRTLVDDELGALGASRPSGPLPYLVSIGTTAGRLRIELAGRGVTAEMRAAVAFAGAEAAMTCEACGAPGTLVDGADGPRTACSRHRHARP
ncbi:MAG: hypothetical protein NVS2B3_11540 [Vulcanimicrobiaceae bacterium]